MFKLCLADNSLVKIRILLFGQVEGDGTILANITAPNNNQIPLAPLAAVPVLGTVFSPTI